MGDRLAARHGSRFPLLRESSHHHVLATARRVEDAREALHTHRAAAPGASREGKEQIEMGSHAREDSTEYVVAEQKLTGTDAEVLDQLDDLIASLLAFRTWLLSPEPRPARVPGRTRRGVLARHVKRLMSLLGTLLVLLVPAGVEWFGNKTGVR